MHKVTTQVTSFVHVVYARKFSTNFLSWYISTIKWHYVSHRKVVNAPELFIYVNHLIIYLSIFIGDTISRGWIRYWNQL